jgi:hypothetical protein
MIIEWGCESQEGIRDWAEENFGPANDAYRVLGRAFEELVEAMKAIAELQTMPVICKEMTPIAEEIADVVITLAGRLPFDLIEAVADGFTEPAQNVRQTLANAAVLLSCAMQMAAEESNHYSAHYIAGCCTQLWHVANTLGFCVSDAVDAKMAKNRERKWNRRSDGTGYHVKEA